MLVCILIDPSDAGVCEFKDFFLCSHCDEALFFVTFSLTGRPLLYLLELLKKLLGDPSVATVLVITKK